MAYTTAADLAIDSATRKLEGRVSDETRRASFLHLHKDPRLKFLIEDMYRHQMVQSGGAKVIPDMEKGKPLLEKLAVSAPMDNEGQFEALSRFDWLLRSYSGVTRDSRQLWLHKMEGLNEYSLEALAQTNGFIFTTLESPGLAETWAELRTGITTLAAAATGTTATLRLYGVRSAVLNKHLRESSPDELATMYEARDSLLTAGNIPVIKIEIPEIPKKFATARAIMELGYFASIELDEGFVEYLMQKKERLARVIEDSSDPIWQYAQKTPTANDYRKLMELLQGQVAEFGLRTLKSEGVTDIADIILRVEGFKEPKDEQGQVIPKETLSKEVKRKSEIWRRFFPSNLASKLIEGVSQVNHDFPNLTYDEKKPWLLYFAGEILDIMKQLIENPARALVKFGSTPERYWDDNVYAILGHPQLVADTFWLFGGIPPRVKTEEGFIMPEHGVFVSVLYGPNVISQKTYAAGHKQVVDRPTYIPYGPTGNKLLADEIPFIADTKDELERKLSIMDLHDPDQISGIVVGAIYYLMNTGNGAPQALRRSDRNTKALSRAARALPQAYQKSIRLLNPNDVPRIIDSRIEEEYQARLKVSEQFDVGLKDRLDEVTRFDSLVRAKRERVRADALTAIKAGIRGLDENLELAAVRGEGYLPERYHDEYIEDVRKFSQQNEDPKAILNFRLEQLAKTFLRFYTVAPRRRAKDEKSQVLTFFLNEKAKVDGVYDLGALEEALESSQEHAFHIKRQLQELRNSTIARRGVYGNSQEERGLKSANGQFTGIVQYLDTIDETIRLLLERKSKLVETLGDDGPHAGIPKDVANKLRPLIGSMGGFVDNTLDYLIWGLNKGDLMQFLKLRFDNCYAKLEQRVRNLESRRAEKFPGEKPENRIPQRSPEDANRLYDREHISPRDEIKLLQLIGAKLRAYEDKYVRSTRGLRYHQATVMLPHELQQFAAMGNIIETLSRYYRMASEYIAGSSDIKPFDPGLKTYKAESAFSMSPQQAASFLLSVRPHLERYNALPHIETQSKRVAGFPVKSLDREAG